MIVIICAKYRKNPSRTEDATERTPFSKSRPNEYRSRSRVIICDMPSHAIDHLYQIWKESILNCRCYREDTGCGTDGRTDRQTDGRTDGLKPIYPPRTSLCGGIIIINLLRPIDDANEPDKAKLFIGNTETCYRCYLHLYRCVFAQHVMSISCAFAS